jgi:hypothetical protein
MNVRPVAIACPHCGSASFARVKAKGPISFTDDRKCKGCGTRYTLPTPPWAGIMFIVIGPLISIVALLVAGVCLLGVIRGANSLFGGCVLFFLVGWFMLGIYCVVYGVRSLNAQPAEAPLVRPEKTQNRPAITKAAPNEGFSKRDHLSQ